MNTRTMSSLSEGSDAFVCKSAVDVLLSTGSNMPDVQCECRGTIRVVPREYIRLSNRGRFSHLNLSSSNIRAESMTVPGATMAVCQICWKVYFAGR